MSLEDLIDWAKANMLVDDIVKAYWNHMVAEGSEPAAHQFDNEAWALYVNGRKVGKFDKHKLYNSIYKYEEKTIEFWAKKKIIIKK
jgi:hypothetical protein